MQDAFLTLTKTARRTERKLAQRIRAATASSERHRIAGLRSKYLHSFHVRLCAVIDTNASQKPKFRLANHELEALARKINTTQPSDERATVHAVQKSLTEYRPVIAFGLENKARQLLVRRLLDLGAEQYLDASQYSPARRGRSAACHSVTRALAEGYCWAQELDFRNCFSSFDGEKLKECLPLPWKVTEATVLTSGADLSVGKLGNALGPVSLLIRSQQGLPQGSKSSSLVCDMMIGCLLQAAKSELTDVQIVSFADNILILSRDKQANLRASMALRGMSKCHPAGSLQLISRGLRRVCDGFDFLGYRFKFRRRKLMVTPTTKNVDSFKRRCTKLIGHSRNKVGYLLKNVVRGWLKAFELSAPSLLAKNVLRFRLRYQFWHLAEAAVA